MRLLNSVCKLISDKYEGVPVYIEDVPEGFDRPSFFVTLATDNSNNKNLEIYEDNPIFQIVYFARQSAARQVYAEDLYKKKEELKALFLLPGAIPLIAKSGVTEKKKRYAKITSFSSEVRLSEKSAYFKVGLNFTEDSRTPEEYELMEDIDMKLKGSRNY